MTAPARPRILFVDDDHGVLRSLQTVMRKHRDRWDTVFVASGELALAALAEGPFDVVVSDLRMPGMGGQALLQRVKDDYPSTARIVLSGEAHSSAFERALEVAHQVLEKPCAPAVLRAAIEQALARRPPPVLGC